MKNKKNIKGIKVLIYMALLKPEKGVRSIINMLKIVIIKGWTNLTRIINNTRFSGDSSTSTLEKKTLLSDIRPS